MAALPIHNVEPCEAGDAWLASCSARPDLAREAWALEALAPIVSGPHWLVAESRLVTGMLALGRIRSDRRGPVLADPSLDRARWLVPPGSAKALAHLRSVVVQPPGTPLHCPPTGRQACGCVWLHRPDGTGQLTDPAILAAALGPVGNLLPEASR
ncbi:hypothetical protein [Streptomyces turgidiscabies]|uniref:DNA primase/polymerase bifunctional N-terminal domain-containing protein n=1 Tax=Streptomyces turgidiscabies TaxID=85558 RepID=A0ABU0RP99_9ACTN|nr:hypothetical protein [Streptomyces turgidiscabies]MDQ0933819.1 hypothetical protein [Streptomyces turgidiscabies]